MDLLARTKRYLANRFLADPDRTDTEEYLQSRRLNHSSPHPATDQRGQGTEQAR